MERTRTLLSLCRRITGFALLGAVATCDREPTQLPPHATASTQAATAMVAATGSGPITHTLLTSGSNPANQKVYTTATISPAPNTLVTIAVMGHRACCVAPRSPTITGGGTSGWTEVATIEFDTVSSLSHKRLTVFRAMSAAPGSGPITITWSATVSNSQWIVSQWDGVQTSGVNGAGAIGWIGTNRADAVNGLTVPLGPFESVGSVAYGVFGVNQSLVTITPGAGFTEIAEQPSAEKPRSDLEAEWATNDNTIDASWATLNGGALGIEIKAAGTPVPVGIVQVTPATASIAIGATVQLTATPLDANGNALAGRTVTWQSDDAGVAGVSASGLVTGVTAGPATITATSEGQSGSSSITVTSPPPGSPVVLVGAGDIADCTDTGDEATAALLDNIAGTVFTAGDNVYPAGSATDFTQCYDPSWGRHKARTRPSPGNHDYDTPGATGYFGYYGALAGSSGTGYYSYDIGGWHIVSLNSNISMSAGSAQEQWLRADLAASPKQCTIAYWHHPRFSSGTHHGSAASTQPLWQALYDAGAEIVISGHEHNYERFAPQTPTGLTDAATGIREFVVGTGGASHYETFGTPLANSEVRDGTTWGVLKLTLDAGTYSWQFIHVAGQTFSDAGSGTCHQPPGTSGVSPTQSTAVASPTSFVAGAGPATITVTVRDANGAPMSGVIISLSATGSGVTLTQPAGPTDADGVATGSLSSTMAGTKTVTALAGGVTLSQQPVVTVNAGVPDLSRSTVTATPATIVAGNGVSTITVTVKDGFDNPVSGSTVTLAAAGTGNTLTQPAGSTNSSGMATGFLSSSDVQTETVSATVDNLAITQTASVTITPASGSGTIVQTLLTVGNDQASQTVYSTSAISPAPNTLVTIAVMGHRVCCAARPSPAISGGGMSGWTEVATIDFDTVSSLTHKRLTVFRAMSAAPGSGPITITWNATVSNSQWIVSQWSGVQTSGVNGAGAIGQTASIRADAVSTLNAALAPFGTANNVAYGVFATNASTLGITPGTGFTEIGEVSSNESPRAVLEAEWGTNRNTIEAMWSGLLNAALLAIEIKAAGP